MIGYVLIAVGILLVLFGVYNLWRYKRTYGVMWPRKIYVQIQRDPGAGGYYVTPKEWERRREKIEKEYHVEEL